MYRQQIEDYFEKHSKQMLEDICTLIRIRSDKEPELEGMPFGEGPARVLSRALEMAEDMGFQTKNYENYVGTVDFGDMPPQLDMLAHLDIVPVGDDWTVTAPFEPVIRDGKLYGRGSADNKGPAVAALYAMKAVRDLGIPLSKNVRLILGTDEECGSSDIAYYYQRQPEAPMTFSPDAEFPVINIEKGGLRSGVEACFDEDRALPRILSVEGGFKINVVPDSAKDVVEGMSAQEAKAYCEQAQKTTGLAFTLTEKDGKLTIQAKGAGAHAAGPETGNNAVTGMLTLLAAMPFAQSEGFAKLCAVSKLFPHGDWEGKAAGVAQCDDISGKLTLSFDIFKYGVTGLTGQFDSRCPICANDANMKDVLKAKSAGLGLQLFDKNMYPAHHVSADTPFVRTLLRCYEQYSGLKGECLAIGGGTYVHNLKNGVAFGCALPGTDNKMHGADEFAVVDELLFGAKLFTQVIIELCR